MIIRERREIMDLKVLIKCLERAIRSEDVRAMDYRADMVRRYLARQQAN